MKEIYTRKNDKECLQLCLFDSMNHSEVINNTSAKTAPRTTLFFKEKRAALGGTRTHDTLQSRQSALPTELPGQTSRQGPKSTIQHTAKASKPQITLCGTQEFMYAYLIPSSFVVTYENIVLPSAAWSWIKRAHRVVSWRGSFLSGRLRVAGSVPASPELLPWRWTSLWSHRTSPPGLGGQSSPGSHDSHMTPNPRVLRLTKVCIVCSKHFL